jgi:hypothetical protein
MYFEAYVHTNNSLSLKRIPRKDFSYVELESPFVKEYLGIVEAETYAEAMKLFNDKRTT